MAGAARLVEGLKRRVFLVGQAVSLFGDGLAILAIPLLVLQLTSSPLAAALSATPRSIGYLIVGLLSGPIVDRISPWPILITADVIRAAVFALLYLLTVAHAAPVWLILGLALVAGGAGVFFESSLTIAVRDLFADDELMGANAFLETAAQTSVVLGPATVGVLAAGMGIDFALLVNALTFMVSLATLAFFARRPGPRPVARGTGGFGAEFRAGLGYLVRTPLIRAMTMLVVLVNLCMAVEKLIVFFAAKTLGLSAPLVSMAVIGGGLGGVAGALTASRLAARTGQIRLIAISLTGIGAALVAVSAAPDLAWLMIANVVLVYATIVAGLVNRTVRQRVVPRELLGRVTSTIRAFGLGATPVGAVLAGTFTQLMGGDPRPVFLGSGLIILIATPLTWFRTLRHHQG